MLPRLLGWLSVIKTALRSTFLIIFGIKKAPPVFIPLRLLNNYTLNGRIKLRYLYFDDSAASNKPAVYTTQQIDACISRVARKEVFYYGQTDSWLYQALEKYNIKGQEVAIIGSVCPVYESICLYYGGRPTTIEYNKIISQDSRLRILDAGCMNNVVSFGAAFSVSSFEHDGLGRYGDKLNPEGDLEAIKKTKEILKPGGILFLAVPVGMDTIVWNAHRIYGRVRLPMLLEDWDILETFGFSEELLGCPDSDIQPIFVLKNTRG